MVPISLLMVKSSPKLNYVVSVVPNPSLAHLKLLECELKIFITDGNQNVVRIFVFNKVFRLRLGTYKV